MEDRKRSFEKQSSSSSHPHSHSSPTSPSSPPNKRIHLDPSVTNSSSYVSSSKREESDKIGAASSGQGGPVSGSNHMKDDKIKKNQEDDIPEDSVLQFQKEAIWRQMQEYKREYHLADERIRKLNIRNDRVEGTLKVVGKWWNTLIEDFRVMINRLSPLGIDELKSMLERESEKRYVFLRFLLSSSMTTDSESLDSYISSRCADAKNLLSQVISILESQSTSASSLSDNDTIKLIDTLQSRHHELNSKISDLESDLFRTTEKLKKTEHELNEAHSLRKRAEKRADRENSTTFKAAFHIEGGNNAKEQNEESNQNASANITSPQAANQNEDPNGIPLTAQISYYTFLATNRLKEIETLKQERINLNKEIDDLKAKLIEIPETVIVEHPVHKVALSQVTFLQKEVHQWRSMGESRGRELEELKRKKEKWLEGLNKEESVRFKNMEEQLKNTHAETVRLRQEREELRGKLALLAEKESYVRQDTNEIRTLANTLKCRINALENEIVRLKETIAIKMNDRSAVEFYAKFPNLALESDMRSRISELEEEVKALRSQLDAYKEAQNPAREMAEVLISEQNLKAQIEQLNKRISKFELILGSNINFDNPEVKSLVEKLSEKQKKIEELEVKVTGNDEIQKALLSEIESLGQSWKELARQNNSKIMNLVEKEDQIAQLLNEKISAQNKFNALQKQMEMYKTTHITQLKRQNEKQSEFIRKLDEKEKTSAQQIMNLEREIAHLNTEMQSHRDKNVQLIQENVELKERVQRSDNKFHDMTTQLKDRGESLEEERHQRKRLAEENDILKRKLDHYTKANAGAVDSDMKKLLEDYKTLLKCPTCNERFKSHVIARCWHVFCKQCIESRLETRQRKCPNCSEPFGVNDVKQIYL